MKEGPTRRELMGVAAGMAAAPSIAGAATPPVRPVATSEIKMVLSINGRDHEVVSDPRTTVLDALREQTGLTGTKKGCDHGQCGACTVHINGVPVLSCLTLATAVQDQRITTIEGLTGADGTLHPMQQAFIDHDAFQCGYCTSGQLMSAVACVEQGHAETSAEIREFMSGNLCRCAAYPNIVAAIMQAKEAMKT